MRKPGSLHGPPRGPRRARSVALRPEIRGASLADWPALDALWREVDVLHARILPGYFRSPRTGGRSRAGLGRILSSPTDALFVAERGGEVLGFVHVQIYDTPDEPTMTPRRRAHVDDLVVGGAHRRAGVGTALMRAAADWARSMAASDIVLTVWSGNQAAEHFYESLGYRALSRVLHKEL